MLGLFRYFEAQLAAFYLVCPPQTPSFPDVVGAILDGGWRACCCGHLALMSRLLLAEWRKADRLQRLLAHAFAVLQQPQGRRRRARRRRHLVPGVEHLQEVAQGRRQGVGATRAEERREKSEESTIARRRGSVASQVPGTRKSHLSILLHLSRPPFCFLLLLVSPKHVAIC